MGLEFSGGCSCGAVRYTLTDRPMFVHCCHCRDCQRQTGSAFVINGLIETDRIVTSGTAPVAVRMPTDSSRAHDVYRCPSCQIALWSDYGGRRYLRFVRIATLDEPHSIRPDVHIFTRSKVPWVTLEADAPAFEVFYEMKDLWPAESLARRQAAAEADRLTM